MELLQLPDIANLSAQLQQQLQLALSPPDGMVYRGPILDVGPTLVRAHLPGVALGELCQVEAPDMLAEVVAIEQQTALLSPFAPPAGSGCAHLAIAIVSVPGLICLGEFWMAWGCRSIAARHCAGIGVS